MVVRERLLEIGVKVIRQWVASEKAIDCCFFHFDKQTTIGCNVSMSLRVPEVKLMAKTEYGRNKVELKPGKGLMDWIRLASTKQLASVNLPAVDHNELIKHNQVTDCWVLLYNNVYDVTTYLEYHPGGVDELMRGAGTDASELFNEYHMWVNYNSMLKSCLVGPFTGIRSKLPKVKDASTNGIKQDDLKQNSAKFLSDLGIRIRVESAQISIDFPINFISSDNVCICAQENDSLRILMRPYDNPSTSLALENINFDEKHAFEVNITSKFVRITFPSTNVLSRCDKIPRQILKDPVLNFYKYQIENITQVNHDCYFYELVSPTGIYCPVPMGHHIIARLNKKGNILTRPFTPLSATCVSPNGIIRTRLKFLIKIYQDGIFTPELVKLKAGDLLELSEPNNRVNIQKLADHQNIVLLAAGSGITPMVRIIQYRHAQKRQTTLIFFNRKRIDLIDGALIDHSYLDDTYLDVKNVLSDEQPVNGGEFYGRVSKELLEKILPTCNFTDTQFFVCGPEGFNIAAVKSLEERGAPRTHTHTFC